MYKHQSHLNKQTLFNVNKPLKLDQIQSECRGIQLVMQLSHAIEYRSTVSSLLKLSRVQPSSRKAFETAFHVRATFEIVSNLLSLGTSPEGHHPFSVGLHPIRPLGLP